MYTRSIEAKNKFSSNSLESLRPRLFERRAYSTSTANTEEATAQAAQEVCCGLSALSPCTMIVALLQLPKPKLLPLLGHRATQLIHFFGLGGMN